MSGKNDGHSLWNLVNVLDEDHATLLKGTNNPFVVHDGVANVEWRTVDLKSKFNDLDCICNSGAKSARGGQQNLLHAGILLPDVAQGSHGLGRYASGVPQIDIREATPADALTRREITWRAWRASYEKFFPVSIIDDLFEDRVAFESSDRLGNTTLVGRWVAMKEDVVVGHISLNRATGEIANIGVLYVDPDHHRMRVGRTLWRTAISEARRQGFRTLVVYTIAGADSCAFYSAMGCELTSEAESITVGGIQVPLAEFRIALNDPSE